AADRRSGGAAPRALSTFLRRSELSWRGGRLHRAESGVGWLRLHHLREPADLRHLQPASSDAGVHGGEPRDQVHRRRNSSRRDGGGEDLALGALRPLGDLLPLRSGRVPRHRAALAEDAGRQMERRGPRGGAAVVAATRFEERPGRLPVCARLGRPALEKVIAVAAAVIQRADGRFLLAQRPSGKVYAGYWEFPGGKIEAGERAEHALARELHEELGIDVERVYPWITREYVYPHGHVRLHFYRVLAWRGEPHPREDQAIAWQALSAPSVSPMLPANAPVLASLTLPHEYAVTDAARLGTATMLAALERRLEQGLQLVQVREPELAHAERERFTAQVLGLAQRPAAGLAAASCHSRAELERAMALGLDFAVLGAVLEKRGAEPLGWERFAEIAHGASIPVYAIGGLTPADLEAAWQRGAHGVAMIRASWR